MISIRLRLALWYAAILFAGLAALTGLAALNLRALLMADIDSSLAKWSKGAEILLITETASNSEARVIDEISEYAASLPEGTHLQLSDAHGRDLLPDAKSPSGATYRTIKTSVAPSGGGYRVQIDVSLSTVHSLLVRFRQLMFFAIPLVLAIASLGGYWISSRALSPVARITSAARDTGIRNLSRRIAVPKVNDELRHLAQTWNEMLGRLETAVVGLSQFTADVSHELRSPIALLWT